MIPKSLKYYGYVILSIILFLIISGITGLLGRDPANYLLGEGIIFWLVVIPLSVIWILAFVYLKYFKK